MQRGGRKPAAVDSWRTAGQVCRMVRRGGHATRESGQQAAERGWRTGVGFVEKGIVTDECKRGAGKTAACRRESCDCNAAAESRVLLIAGTILLTARGGQLSPSCCLHVEFVVGPLQQRGRAARAWLQPRRAAFEHAARRQQRWQPAAWRGRQSAGSNLPPAQTWAVTVGAGCDGGAGCAAVSSCPALREAVRVSSRSMICRKR